MGQAGRVITPFFEVSPWGHGVKCLILFYYWKMGEIAFGVLGGI